MSLSTVVEGMKSSPRHRTSVILLSSGVLVWLMRMLFLSKMLICSTDLNTIGV